MYYLVPNENNEADIYGYKPDVEYLETNIIPERPLAKIGYQLKLYADIEKQEVWWDYVSSEKIIQEQSANQSIENQSNIDLLKECIMELAQEVYGG